LDGIFLEFLVGRYVGMNLLNFLWGVIILEILCTKEGEIYLKYFQTLWSDCGIVLGNHVRKTIGCSLNSFMVKEKSHCLNSFLERLESGYISKLLVKGRGVITSIPCKKGEEV